MLQYPVTQIKIYLDSFPGGIQYVLSFSFSVSFSVTSDNYILSAVLQFTPEYRIHQLILRLRGQYYLALEKFQFLKIRSTYAPHIKVTQEIGRPVKRILWRDPNINVPSLSPVSTWLNQSWPSRWQGVGQGSVVLV